MTELYRPVRMETTNLVSFKPKLAAVTASAREMYDALRFVKQAMGESADPGICNILLLDAPAQVAGLVEWAKETARQFGVVKAERDAALAREAKLREAKKLLEEYECHLRTLHEGAVEEVRDDFTSGIETGLRTALEHLETLRATGAKEQA